MTDDKTRNETVWNAIISSSVAGLAARTIMHPVDTLKARLQVQRTFKPQFKSLGPAITTGVDEIYKNSFDAIKTILRYEGIRGFYRGLGVALAFTGPAQTLFLTSYDVAKNHFSSFFGLPDSHFIIHLSSGLFAEALSCIIWVPHDVMKERLQVTRRDTSGFREVAKVVRHDGIRHLYKGYWMTLGTFGPNSATYFLCYEKLKDFIANLRNVDRLQLHFSDYQIAGAISASIAAIVTNPLDVIKTRFQVQRRTKEKDVYKGFFDGWRKMVSFEGYRALWKGLPARIMYSAPNYAIIMSLYEYCKKRLKEWGI